MRIPSLPAVLLSLTACSTPDATQPAPDTAPPNRTAYREDLAFLRSHDPDLVVLERGGASVATSAKYQGKVFTSSATGEESFGYLDYDVFEAETPGDHINGYGGENRLWIGPEGGPLSVFFDGGVAYTPEDWYVPAAIDREPWDLVRADSVSVVFAKAGQASSRAGTDFDFRLDREVRLLPASDALPARAASPEAPSGGYADDLRRVAYRTTNRLTNAGAAAWTRETGTICLWALDMLPASDSAVVVYPLADGTGAGDVRPYFGEMTAAHRRVVDGALFFRGDGTFRAKVGLSPKHATGRGGSIDLVAGTLTVIEYDVDPEAAYLGMEWAELADPYDGDATTTYNDPGPGTFYEIESIGEAAFLAPGESTTHTHDVYHFTGPTPALLAAAERLLGVGAADLRTFLRED